MRNRSAYFLLIVASCPITTSVAVLPVLKNIVSTFSSWPAPNLWLSIYFIIPALMTAFASIMLRRFIVNLKHDFLLAVGIFGFALCGMAGYFINDGVLALLSRAGLGVSSAMTMNAFNALAFRRYNRDTSTWLLTFLNVATSTYGLFVAFAVGELVKVDWRFAYLVFGLPIPIFGFFYAFRPLRGPANIERVEQNHLRTDLHLNRQALLAVVTGHMAIHILVYLHMSRTSTNFLGFTADTTTATICYLLGHILGAVSYRRVESFLSDPHRHVLATLFSSLIASLGLFFAGNSPFVLPFLALVGISLSHIMPVIFSMIRDAFSPKEQGVMIGNAVAAGFLGQFLAPFLLYLYWPIAGQPMAPVSMCVVLSLLLLPIGFALYGRAGRANYQEG